MVKRKAQTQATSSKAYDFVKQIEEHPRFFWLYAAAILVFVVVLFNKFIFSNAMLYGSDTIQAGVFFREFMVDYYKAHGSVPMWNPYIFCGMPFVDAFHGDIFYLPTFIIKMLLPLQRALGWGLILHIYLAGIFTYICARGFGLSRVASAFAGVSYMFAGYLVSLVAPGHDGKIFVTALFPLAFHFLNRGTITFRLKWFLLLGLTISLIILTPHPQMAYFTLWALGGFFIYRLVFMLRDKVGNAKAALMAAMFVLAIVVGLLGSAIQFYPGYKYIQEFSPRAGEGAEGRSGYEWATSWSMHLEELVGQFIPFFAGVSVNDPQAKGGYWGRNAFKDNTEYTGFFPIMIGIIGVALWRRRETWFFLGMASLALVYALGATTPLFYIFYAIIPNVGKMRAPSMIMFLFSFSFVMLAAFGIDALIKLRNEAKTRIPQKLHKALIITASALTVLALLFSAAGKPLLSVYTSIFYSGIGARNIQMMDGNLPNVVISLWVIALLCWAATYLIRGYVTGSVGRVALFALIFISLIDLWRVDFRFIDVVDYNLVFPRLPVVERLKTEKEPVRVMDLTRQTQGTRNSKNYFALNGIEQLVGYHGAQLKTFDEFIGGLSYSRLIANQGINLRPFQLTGTKYIVLDRGAQLPEEQGFVKVYDNDVTMYETPHSMRRASIYHAYQLAPNTIADLDLLYEDNFPYLSTLLVSEVPEYQPTLPDSGARESVEIVEHEIAHQRYNVEMATAGLLFISENYFPGWKVKVDGVEKKLLKADHTFRAVSLDKGSHDVEIYWDWPRYTESRLVTILTVIFSGLGVVACLFYERKTKGTSA
jgi:hypothetical protein